MVIPFKCLEVTLKYESESNLLFGRVMQKLQQLSSLSVWHVNFALY